MSAVASFLDLFDWWRQQVAGLFPKLKRPLTEQKNLIRIRIPLSDDEAGALVNAMNGEPSITIKVTADHFLTRHLTSQTLPRRRAEAMAKIDIMANTPIDPADVFVVFEVPGKAPKGTRFHIIKRRIIPPVVEAAIATGAEITEIVLDGRTSEILLDRRSIRSIVPRRKSARIIGYGLIALYASCALGIFLTYTHLKSRYTNADATLDAAIARVSPEAHQVKELLNQRENLVAQVATLRKRDTHSESLVRVWEELTRTMPDTAWLTDLEYNTNFLRVSGFAMSAAGLIPALEASPLFRAPTFTDPVIRIPGQDGERFTIRMEMEKP